MKTTKILRTLLWLPALLFTAQDALAWGLYTHIWFAQGMLWLVPLVDPKFRQAAKRLPQLVMAGSCLPDLALVGDIARSKRFDDSHCWTLVEQQLRNASTDEERALALGYTSHLLSDIFAHNHFVPAHESMWADIPILTHASCEWALDHHVRKELFSTPGKLLHSERATLIAYLGTAFGCTAPEAGRLIDTLGNADRLLRTSQLPAVVYHSARLADRHMQRRFNHYLSNTVRRLDQINAIIAGDNPTWPANPHRETARAAIAGLPPHYLRLRPSLPRDIFSGNPNEHVVVTSS